MRLVKIGLATLWAANQVRGILLAAPVIVSLIKAGGAPMAFWVGLCMMFGIMVEVCGPILVWKAARKFFDGRRKARLLR